MKSSLALRPVRVWLQAHVEVHLLICHLAYALLTTFRFFINKARGKPCFSQLDGISAEEALDELTQVYRVYFHKVGASINPEEPTLSKLVTLSKRQETILKAISPDLLKL